MVDRALTFSDPEIVRMLQSDFVPVAIDQWNHRRQEDAEGEFYRRVAGQGPRSDFNVTTQGRYICSPDGKLLAFNNNRGPEKIAALMRKALEEFDFASLAEVEPLDDANLDPKFRSAPPTNGLVLRVHSKVLNGYAPLGASDDWKSAFQESIGRDNVWLTREESHELAICIRIGGKVPERIAYRLARFHFIDNTRGEPHRWTRDEVKQIQLSVDQTGKLTGSVHLESEDGKQGFKADILGIASAGENEITRLDMVAKGEFWGHGRFTGHAPKGKFPLAIAFRIADGSDTSDAIIPYGLKGLNGRSYFE